MNLIIVLHADKKRVLMCKRQKDPFKGQLNFVGGKVEANEDYVAAAYRELEEETGITQDKITLHKLMFTQYFAENLELQVYYGCLSEDLPLTQEINPLVWIDRTTDFASDQFAGNGNIQHMMQCLHDILR